MFKCLIRLYAYDIYAWFRFISVKWAGGYKTVKGGDGNITLCNFSVNNYIFLSYA